MSIAWGWRETNSPSARRNPPPEKVQARMTLEAIIRESVCLMRRKLASSFWKSSCLQLTQQQKNCNLAMLSSTHLPRNLLTSSMAAQATKKLTRVHVHTRPVVASSFPAVAMTPGWLSLVMHTRKLVQQAGTNCAFLSLPSTSGLPGALAETCGSWGGEVLWPPHHPLNVFSSIL